MSGIEAANPPQKKAGLSTAARTRRGDRQRASHIGQKGIPDTLKRRCASALRTITFETCLLRSREKIGFELSGPHPDRFHANEVRRDMQ